MAYNLRNKNNSSLSKSTTDGKFNNSYVLVVHDGDDNGKVTQEELISDLRDKLASANAEVVSLNDEIGKLKLQVLNATAKINRQNLIIENLKQTLDSAESKPTLKNLSNTSVPAVRTAVGDHNDFELQPDVGSPSTNGNALDDRDSIVNNILLLGDSYGRHIADFLRENLSLNTTVTSIIKPNAKLEDIVCNVKALTTNFTSNDWVLIVGGSNDFPMRTSSRADLLEMYRYVCESCKNTKVLFCGVPYRYDVTEFDEDIFLLDELYYDLVSSYDNCKFIDINFYLNRSHYTRHGLHFNIKGKRLLGQRFLESINVTKQLHHQDTQMHVHSSSKETASVKTSHRGENKINYARQKTASFNTLNSTQNTTRNVNDRSLFLSTNILRLRGPTNNGEFFRSAEDRIQDS